MQIRLTRMVLIAAVAIVYALITLPLPYLLVDHYSAIQAGDSNHSDVDIHAWLEWAAGSSLSGTGLVLLSVLNSSRVSTNPPLQVFARLLEATSYPRGPPAPVPSRHIVPLH